MLTIEQPYQRSFDVSIKRLAFGLLERSDQPAHLGSTHSACSDSEGHLGRDARLQEIWMHNDQLINVLWWYFSLLEQVLPHSLVYVYRSFGGM
jgi:hypothetical protein